MSDSAALIASLRRAAATAGAARADDRGAAAWLAGGLARGHLHEIHAADQGDGAAAAGFAVALALAAAATPVLWLRPEAAERQAGRLHATGLAELGLSPAQLLLVLAADEPALLRAAADAARCAAVGTLLLESWGPMPGLDLTATRRLMLAAEASGVTVLSLRMGAAPTPSAAATRWGVAAVASAALAGGGASAALNAGAPGPPAFDVECLRRRGGPSGARWRVEWNRERRCFEPLAETALAGAGLPLAVDRPAAPRPAASVRRA